MMSTHTCTFIIFGASGDLTRRKLLPAIYKLIEEKKVAHWAIVGVALTPTTATDILASAQAFIPAKDPAIWEQLVKSFYYQQFDFYRDEDYQKLKQLLATTEKTHGLAGNRLFYLATMPEHFAAITQRLADQKIVPRQTERCITDGCEPWARVVYEKPFGSNLASARQINQQIANVFSEDQVFRIDHYLGKELVGNIELVRFTNLFFQPLWNNQYIDSVQIIVSEKIGIEGRGEFYDRYGAIKDVAQNHLLQLVALVGMEAPERLGGEHIRNAKVRILKDAHITHVLRGQYRGYLNERGVAPESTTETFAALRLVIENDRWKGVPFFLKTGKSLEKKKAAIHIIFKQAPCLLVAENCPVNPNCLTIAIEPEAGFSLEINAKSPGMAQMVTPITMNFSHAALFGPNTPQAYEVLLVDAIRGDQSVFVRFDEVECSWHIIDPIMTGKSPLYLYEQGSDGPIELAAWSKEMGVQWRG